MRAIYTRKFCDMITNRSNIGEADVIAHTCGRSVFTVPFTFAVSVSPSPFSLLPDSLTYGFMVSALERPSCLDDMLLGPLVEPMARGYPKVRELVVGGPISSHVGYVQVQRSSCDKDTRENEPHHGRQYLLVHLCPWLSAHHPGCPPHFVHTLD